MVPAAATGAQTNLGVGSRRSDHLCERTHATDLPQPNACTPLTELAHKEDEGRLVLALNSLPEDEQRLLRCCLLGKPLDAVLADELGVEPVTLRKRLQRARESLTKALGKV